MADHATEADPRVDPLAAAVERALGRDPAGAYPNSDAYTRWRCRRTIDAWCVRSGLRADDLAQRVLARAREVACVSGPSAPAAHVGYHVLGAGARAMEAATCAPRRWTGRVREALVRQAAIVYPALLGVSVAALVGTAAAVGNLGVLAWPWRAAALAAFVPVAVRYAGPAVRGWLAQYAPRAPLPRLDPDSPAARDLRVFVVMPAVVPTPARARELVARLAHMAACEPDPAVRFALLADFVDAPSAHMPDDAAVLAAEREVVARVNADLRDALGDRVFVLHRGRRWSASQRAWIGWERKRGKLLQFLRLLDGASSTPAFGCIMGDLTDLLARAHFPYVLTLDEATWLNAGQAGTLARIAAHPLNRAALDDTADRLAHGYAIFQPAIVEVPAADGPWQSTPVLPPGAVSARVADWAPPALGAGIYRGRGLLDVRACLRLLDGTFPDDIVLHHDLLEGFAARTAEVEDAYLVQTWPESYVTQLRRGHRWLRGYVQALPWVLLPRVRDADGGRRGNPLRPTHRILVGEIVIAELQKPASLALLFAAWTFLPRAAIVWALAACPLAAAFLVTGVVDTLASLGWRARTGFAPGARSVAAPRPMLSRALAAGFQIATLPLEALVVLDAVARSLWRLLVSRRRLLDWTTAHTAAAAAPRAERDYWRALWPSALVGVGALAATASLRPARLLLAAPFATLWLCAPWLVRAMDRAVLDAGPAIPEPIREPD